MVFAVSVSGCTDFFNNIGDERQKDAEAYAQETGAQTYNGSVFSFFYPKNWDVYNNTSTVYIIDPNDTLTYLYLESWKLQSNQTVEGRLDEAIKETENNESRQINITSREKITVSDIPYIIVKVDETINGTQIKYLQAWFEKDGTAYILGGVTTPEKFDNLLRTFEMFIYSFKFN